MEKRYDICQDAVEKTCHFLKFTLYLQYILKIFCEIFEKKIKILYSKVESKIMCSQMDFQKIDFEKNFMK